MGLLTERDVLLLQGMPNMNSGVDSMFALRSLLSEGGAPPSMYGDALGQRVSGLPEWNGGHRGHGTIDPPPAVTHDFHCAVDTHIQALRSSLQAWQIV